MNYTIEESIEMIYILGECSKNCLLASRVYGERFPDRRHPDARSFQRLMDRFDRTGTVKYEKHERAKPVTNEENEFNVIATVVEDPQRSTADLSNLLDIGQTSIKNNPKKRKFHPYHMQLNQALEGQDFENRINFCNWCFAKMREDIQFFNLVMFTDEATFLNDGHVNRHNLHFYADVNPHFRRTVDRQHRWSVNVWGGIIGDHIIGPHFFDGHLNGNIFQRFLNEDLDNYLENIPLELLRKMWFQLDGAPAHFSVGVRNILDEKFPNRWIGRHGPVAWPHRSPDLSKLDYPMGIR